MIESHERKRVFLLLGTNFYRNYPQRILAKNRSIYAIVSEKSRSVSVVSVMRKIAKRKMW